MFCDLDLMRIYKVRSDPAAVLFKARYLIDFFKSAAGCLCLVQRERIQLRPIG